MTKSCIFLGNYFFVSIEAIFYESSYYSVSHRKTHLKKYSDSVSNRPFPFVLNHNLTAKFFILCTIDFIVQCKFSAACLKVFWPFLFHLLPFSMSAYHTFWSWYQFSFYSDSIFSTSFHSIKIKIRKRAGSFLLEKLS